MDDWHARIPEAFKTEHISTTASGADMAELTRLHHDYLFSLISLHGVYSRSAGWQGKVTSLSRAALHDCAAAIQGQRNTACLQNQNPPLVEGWGFCVDIRRGFVKLLQEITPSEFLIW